MTIQSVRQDFGGFDARFPGITIKIANQRVWNVLETLLSIEAAPVLPTVDDRLWFETCSAATVLFHELRHFHDALKELLRSRDQPASSPSCNRSLTLGRRGVLNCSADNAENGVL